MKNLKPQNDIRERSFCCAYCRGDTETREHVPSKVFLDEPYPDNLPTLHSCRQCNEGFALDEEYVACAIECARGGGVNVENLHRIKIKRILFEQTALQDKLLNKLQTTPDRTTLLRDKDRIERILLKLAYGHALFEHNDGTLSFSQKPAMFMYGTLDDLADTFKDKFETAQPSELLPEVGSVAFQRLFLHERDTYSGWVNVQEGQYRYMTPSKSQVRIVISEYFFVYVAWE